LERVLQKNLDEISRFPKGGKLAATSLERRRAKIRGAGSMVHEQLSGKEKGVAAGRKNS